MAYTERAGRAPSTIRIRKLRAGGLLVVIAALIALGLEHRASSPSRDSSLSTATAPSHPRRGDRPGPLGENGGAAFTGRLGLGEADGAIPDGTTVFDEGIPGVAKLDPALLRALRRAATDAGREGVGFLVDSGWRSAAYQERLLEEAVSKYGSETEAARWVAPPGRSAHVSGEAVDLGTDGAAWLRARGAAYGLCQIYANEPWHFELRPGAVTDGCPAMYADPAHDPRLQQ